MSWSLFGERFNSTLGEFQSIQTLSGLKKTNSVRIQRPAEVGRTPETFPPAALSVSSRNPQMSPGPSKATPTLSGAKDSKKNTGRERFQSYLQSDHRGDVWLITFPNGPDGRDDIRNLEELLQMIKLEASGKTQVFFRG